MTLLALCLHFKPSSLFITPALTHTQLIIHSFSISQPQMSVRHIDFHLCNNNNRARVHRRTCITLHVPTSIFTRKLEEWRRSAGVTVTHGVAHETPHSSSWQTIRDQRHTAERPRGPGMETLVECLTYAAVR